MVAPTGANRNRAPHYDLWTESKRRARQFRRARVFGIIPAMVKRFLMAVLLVVVLATVVAWLWLFYRDGGVTHRDLADLVVAEGAATRARVDERCDALDAKLDRIESKLDRLIQLATPQLPDGMKAAE